MVPEVSLRLLFVYDTHVRFRCLAPPDELEAVDVPRFREHTQTLWETFNAGTLWNTFGVVNDVTVSV